MKRLLYFIIGCSFSFINAQSFNRDEDCASIDQPSAPYKQSHETPIDYFQRAQFYAKKNKDSSLVLFKRYLNFHRNDTLVDLKAKAHWEISALLYNSGEFQPSLKHLDSANYYFKTDKDTIGIIEVLQSRGTVYASMGELEKALTYYFDVLELLRLNKGTEQQKYKSYNNLGIFYTRIGELKKGKIYLQKAVQVSKILKMTDLHISALINLGNIEIEQGNYGLAFSHEFETLRLADSINDKNLMRLANNNISHTHYLVKNYDKSIFYAKRALRLKSDDIDGNGASTYHTLGMVYMALKNYELSEEYFVKAIDISRRFTMLDIEQMCNYELYKLKQKRGQYKAALRYHKNYEKIKDKLFGSSVQANILKMESERQLMEKERTINKLSVENDEYEAIFSAKVQNFIKIILSLIVLATFISVFYYLRNKAQQADTEKKLTENKMQILRSQMNPHFIFNTITGIQNFILKSDKYAAYDYLTKFSESIRLIFENSGQSFIPLNKELELITRYINLEKIRFKDRILYQEEIDQTLFDTDPMVATMILQPIIENGILHGLSNKKGSGQLKLRILEQNGYLKCTIHDNGIGRKLALKIKKKNNHLSSATINTRQRIDILRKMGYTRSNITYTDLYDDTGCPEGTEVTIVLPQKRRYDTKNESTDRRR